MQSSNYHTIQSSLCLLGFYLSQAAQEAVLESNWHARQDELCTTNWVWNNVHLDDPHSTKVLFGKFFFKKHLGVWRLTLIDSWCSLLADFPGSCLVIIWSFYLKCYSLQYISFISSERGIIVKAAQKDDTLVFCKLRSFKSDYIIKLGNELQWKISRCFEAKPTLALFHLSRNTAQRNLVW